MSYKDKDGIEKVFTLYFESIYKEDNETHDKYIFGVVKKRMQL